jgi:hypothetical protein
MHRPTDGEVSIRVLVVAAVAAALGAIAWRFPLTVNPMLIAVAAYAVLDRVTAKPTF